MSQSLPVAEYEAIGYLLIYVCVCCVEGVWYDACHGYVIASASQRTKDWDDLIILANKSSLGVCFLIHLGQYCLQ